MAIVGVAQIMVLLHVAVLSKKAEGISIPLETFQVNDWFSTADLWTTNLKFDAAYQEQKQQFLARNHS
ncbi:MAG: hypothetical protein HFJ84_07835 [Clostridiales bacterium]|jgi:hypothetical protein|nr:hypothetical protein [Clostridiales bacterium]